VAMRCPKCDTKNPRSSEACSKCQAPINKARDAAYPADPQVAKMVAWSLLAMGALGLIFVIVNSGQDWHTWLDYVGPAALLAVGGFSLIRQKAK
jgi:hypothetical protein